MSDPRDRDYDRGQDDRFGPATYLTPEEAKEFHKLFILSFLIFTAVAIVAHFLAWNWRPWGGHYSMLEHGMTAARGAIAILNA